ncbi:NACHT, LRR and PYD domains-containing protein 3-like isoform X2 [Chanodichthys erythropterus]|uniref:NACHT, LRR and PYD domains-containing protein 3-like isoform X2 n=1 Tax=Chanodichthys erythropterus TaxID=933992 RepID=UPI00351EC755
MENLLQAQDRQCRLYDRGTNLRKFAPGEKVLVLLPTSSSKLLAKWQGPFEVTRRIGDLDYEVIRSDRRGARQIYHLNLLKKWSEAESVMLATVISGEDDLGPEANVKKQSLALAPGGDHLSPSQLTDVSKLQAEFADVFSPVPGRTDLIQHHIETEPGVVIRSRPYRLPEHKKKVVQAELEAMLDMGVIEESSSNWASPIVLVPKTDGSVRFCVDYRKVNAVSKFDAYPMPRVDELLDRLGTARFYSTLDLTKGYWQIPLSPLSKEKTAFTTPFGLHQFVTLPFGLFGAPATFQRLMDKVLRPHAAYAAAYLDDIIIFSNDWQRHMQHLRAVLRSLRGAGLTANPKKCAIGRVEVRYLGFHLGYGQVRPQIDKTAAVATCPRPKTKKEVRQFLGLAGYYRRFVPNYSDLTSPLTDLTKKDAPDTVQWTELCQQAFTQVKAALCGGPLLHSPDFSLPFLLQTDASDRGLGAVLSQEIEGEERPVLYISRKLSKREAKYSTVEKECLAIRWAVLTLRYYLLGREFTLCSDHAPLQWLHRMKDTNARITHLMLQKFLKTHKANMKKEAEHIFEGKKENDMHLNDVYTELFITVGDIKDVKQEHEILKTDDIKTRKSQDRPIKCIDIFTELRKNNEKKIVLTKGISGIGKTVSVHKFILDWAEGNANQDIDCVFLLPFGEINMIKDKEVNLHKFLLNFYPELKDLEKSKLYRKYNLAFIFDGLDESNLSLNFKSENLSSVEEKSSVDVLFTSLVKGKLLPSALIWVTSRPAAANQIPPKHVGLFTEVKGFNDRQKEDYFKKRITDKTRASRIISYIKTSRSLFIMCHIPVFCWITATVLENENNAENIIATLTEMYIHFLLIQLNMKNQKYDEKEERECEKHLELNREIILKLAKLAFEQLKNKNVLFKEDDLKECGIDVNAGSEFTGMIVEIFKKQDGLHEKKVFCFVHRSIQEFLAAVYVFFCYLKKDMQELQFFFEDPQQRARHKLLFFFRKIFKKVQLHDLMKMAIDKAMQSQSGHLDLFLRFLMGISQESSQNLLTGLFKRTKDTTKSIIKISAHIKQLQNESVQDEASVNLFFCLLELKDHSLHDEIQKYLSSDEHPARELSSAMCSVLVYRMLMSDMVFDEFNPKKFTSPAYYTNLVPAVRCCRKALFDGCGLLDRDCEILSSAIQSSNSHLTELDLSNNDLMDSGVNLLSAGLKSSHCQLNILRMAGCRLTGQCCESFSLTLQSSNSSLKVLDLSNNDLRDSGIKLLTDGLKNSHCHLNILRLVICNLTAQCCESMSSALKSSNSCLRELDLSNNDLKDSGVEWLSAALKSSHCQLNILRLSGCMVTEKGCRYLSSAISSNLNSCLRELDLSYNHPGESGVKPLDKLNVDHGGEFRITAGLHKWLARTHI